MINKVQDLNAINGFSQHSWCTFEATALAQNLICCFMSPADLLEAQFGIGGAQLCTNHASDKYLRFISIIPSVLKLSTSVFLAGLHLGMLQVCQSKNDIM
ncbi:hypothetical protein VIGAN_07137500 [Vigna angularis var. angularis]|uniref:Uncharacterized protein n=1 Tax=Vigna angularis var. angularis TaxID=157739 RepID=A0A0S3SIG7_PHAAN|nr:hypothetical protein VIGAN_07137500 [Vigna angularis var. angularis]